MFDWNTFSAAAVARLESESFNDDELRSILALSHPPAEATDEVGRPLIGSAVIHQHPDIQNFRRIIGIRKQIAEEKGARDYVLYANQIQSFLNSFPTSLTLFVLLIATHKDLYEFLFVPGTRNIFVAPFHGSSPS